MRAFSLEVLLAIRGFGHDDCGEMCQLYQERSGRQSSLGAIRLIMLLIPFGISNPHPFSKETAMNTWGFKHY